ncbi:MAG: rod shape-determining protein RodA [Nitrospinota bacterium]|nr:rod shape-determining protein RodA [Nitrospinota bacterium]MDH5756201.1 rod shape-determining protein RodA [Nitrospinota bacterium]
MSFKSYSPDKYAQRQFIKIFDFPLLGMILALCAVGVVAIYSANLQSESAFMKGLYLRQTYFIAFSLVLMMAVLAVDYRTLERFAYPLYFAGLAALTATLVIGKIGGGSRRWLELVGYNIQPSEIMKIILIIILARVFGDILKKDDLGARDLIKPGVVTLVPFLLVASQPDLGTAMILVFIFVCMAFFNGLNSTFLIRTAVALAMAAPSFWFLLKPYQQKRILTLLNPEADPMGHGYHIIQSKIAIGSGGLWGKGIFMGTQSKLNFLPAKHTDFIFSVFAEEIGFFGAAALIALFFVLILRMMEVMGLSKDKFGSLLVMGVVSMISFNFLFNIGMTMGLFPVVGIPLPFISYGGSALVTNFIGVGLILNVSMGRFKLD